MHTYQPAAQSQNEGKAERCHSEMDFRCILLELPQVLEFDGSSGSLPLENQTPCFSAWLLQEKSQFAGLNLLQSDLV